MVLPADGHAEIVEEGGKDDSDEPFVEIPRFLRLKARPYPGFLQESHHDYRVEGDFPHMHGTVVIVSQPLDRNGVGVFLHGVHFRVRQEQERDFQRQFRYVELIYGGNQFFIQR